MQQGLLLHQLVLFILLYFFSGSASALSADIFLGGAIGEGEHKRFRARNSDTIDTIFDPGFTITTTSAVRGGDDKGNFAWRVFGGAWLHSHFGIQLEYVDFGHTSFYETTQSERDVQLNFGSPRVFLAPFPFGSNTEFDLFSKTSLTGIAALAKTRYPISRKLNLELNLGAVRWDSKGHSRGGGDVFFGSPLTVTTNSQGGFRFRTKQRELGYDAVYGLSVEYELAKSLSLGFDWIRYELGPLDEHADFLGASFKYQFNLGTRSLNEEYHRGSTPLVDAVRSLWTENIIARRTPDWTAFIALSPGWGLRNSGAEGDDNETDAFESNFVFSRTEFLSVKKVDKQSFIGKAEIGVFFNRHFGASIGYIDLGEYSSREIQLNSQTLSPLFGQPAINSTTLSEFRFSSDTNALSFNGIARVTPLKRIELFVAFGALAWHEETRRISDVTPNTIGFSLPSSAFGIQSVEKDSNSGVDINYGVGASVKVYNNYRIGFEYNRYEFGPSDQDVESFNIKFELRFGGSQL